jgi:hypothetical protein
VFYACPLNDQACPSSSNGTCNTGYFGPLCASCLPGYHNTGRACEPCQSASVYLVLILVVVVLLLGFLAWYLFKRLGTSKFVTIAKILVSFLQVMGSSSKSYNIPWSSNLNAVLSYCRLALLDLFSVVAVDCVQTYDFFTPFYATTLLTLALIGLAYVAHQAAPRVLPCLFPDMDVDTRKRVRGWSVKFMAIYMSIFYPAISLQVCQ